MRNRRLMTVLFAGEILLLNGCETHLAFIEESHMGLKVEFSSDATAPVDIDLGYYRGVAAFIPQRMDGEDKPSVKKEDGKLEVKMHRGELVSLFSRSEANIGFADPFSSDHLLATGIAAYYVSADPECLEYIWKQKATMQDSKTEDKNKGES